MKTLKIKSVKSLGVRPVYDLTMPTHHNFILDGGVVAHNCPHSWHYGVITAVTLFLKAHYTPYYFRVVMALSKVDQAARFLGEIADQVRLPCVLTSDELIWRIVDNKYFPGLSMIEGLNKKNIARILDCQARLKADGVSKPSAETFFKYFGTVTPSLALTLSKSGSLRQLGSPDEIADGYVAAIVNHIKPRLAKQKAEAKKKEKDALRQQNQKIEALSGSNISGGLDDDGLGDLLFELRTPSKKVERVLPLTRGELISLLMSEISSEFTEGDLYRKGLLAKMTIEIDGIESLKPQSIKHTKNNNYKMYLELITRSALDEEGLVQVMASLHEEMSEGWGASLSYDGIELSVCSQESDMVEFEGDVFEKMGGKDCYRYSFSVPMLIDCESVVETSSDDEKNKKFNYKLSREDQEVVDVLRNSGMRFSDTVAKDGSSQSGTILTVESAVESIKGNKAKAGVRHLVKALQKKEIDDARKEKRSAVLYLSLKELKELKRENGSSVSPGLTYRTVGIPQGVSMAKNSFTNLEEPKITFLAEGERLNAKFSLNFPKEQLEEMVQVLKDEKMTSPFIIDVYVGQMKKERIITYYKIEKLTKL